MCIYNGTNIDTNAHIKFQSSNFSCPIGYSKTWQVPQADKILNNFLIFSAKAVTWERLEETIEWYSFLLPHSPPKQTTSPADFFVPARHTSAHQQMLFTLYLFCGSIKKKQKSRFENTCKISFKKLICVITADIKTEDTFFFESSNF